MDNFFAPFARSHIKTDLFPIIPLVVHAKKWLKVQVGEIPRPKVWQVIDTLPIAIKVSQFAQDASLVQQKSIPYVKSLMIFPTPGFNPSPQKDVHLRFFYTPSFGKASRFQKSTHNIYIFSNNNKHKTLVSLLLYYILRPSVFSSPSFLQKGIPW